MTDSPTQPTDRQTRLALASLLCGLLTFLTFFTGIPAVLCGHAARRLIKKSPHSQKGKSMATIGLLLGYIGMLLWLMGFGDYLTIHKIQKKAATGTTPPALLLK